MGLCVKCILLLLGKTYTRSHTRAQNWPLHTCNGIAYIGIEKLKLQRKRKVHIATQYKLLCAAVLSLLLVCINFPRVFLLFRFCFAPIDGRVFIPLFPPFTFVKGTDSWIEFFFAFTVWMGKRNVFKSIRWRWNERTGKTYTVHIRLNVRTSCMVSRHINIPFWFDDAHTYINTM